MLLYHGPSKRTRFSQLMVKYKNFAMNHTLANAIRIPSAKKQIRIAIRNIPAIQTVISFFQLMLMLQPRCGFRRLVVAVPDRTTGVYHWHGNVKLNGH